MKIGIKVLGCPKNVADCEILASQLKKSGHEIVKSAEDADLVIIDTCTFIEDAKKECIDVILDFVDYKIQRKDLKLIVKGCMVQRYYKELKKEIPEVDAWVGVLPPERVLKAVETLKDDVSEPLPNYECYERYDLEGKPYAYVKIADGCDRKCAFCSIPAFKGNYKSRSVEVILKEVEKLLVQGKKEIVLVSQDNTGYGVDLYGEQALPKLLKEISKLKGDFWVRVMYLHPDYISDEIIKAIAENEKVLPYFEIPIQHGSKKILKKMGRIKSPEEISRLFEKIRSISTDATIRTTIMVGFPGETEKDFEELLDFLEKTRPDRMGVFVYSDEEGTLAYNYNDKVDKEVAKEREEIVLGLSLDLMKESNERWIGKTIKGIVEEDDGEIYVRSFMDAPEIDGYIMLKDPSKLSVGEFIYVKITGVNDIFMEGIVVG